MNTATITKKKMDILTDNCFSQPIKITRKKKRKMII